MNIKVNSPCKPFTTQIVTFTAPCNCDEVTDGLVINGETYTVCDAMGECVTGKGGAWCAGAQISVVLDCENKKAFIQNAASPNLKEALTAHIDNQNNPHNVTADQVAVTENVVNAIRETGNWSVDGVLTQLGNVLFGSDTLYRWNKSRQEFVCTNTNNTLATNLGNSPKAMTVRHCENIEFNSDGTINMVQPITSYTLSNVGSYAIPNGEWVILGETTTNLTQIYKATATSKLETTSYMGEYSFIYHNKLSNVDLWEMNVVSTIVTSTDPNAHYDGEVDAEGYTYNALDPITAFVPRIQTGSYVGTGTYGATNKCSLTFSFEPKMVLICCGNGESSHVLHWVQGMTRYTTTSADGTAIQNGNTFSWFGIGAQYQLNVTSSPYYWIAIG